MSSCFIYFSMCSVNENDIDSLQLEMRTQCSLKELVCKKCDAAETRILLRNKDAYCRECFLKNVTHKFRATLGKSKLIRPSDRLLLATSGSLASAALLHMIAEGLSEKNNKRFLFTSLAVYIDEGAVLNQSNDERMEAIKAIHSQATNLGFELLVVQLSNIFELKNICIYSITNSIQYSDLFKEYTSQLDERLRNVFDSTNSLTSKEDLLSRLRNNLLVAVAKQLDCKKIVLGETGSQLAVQLLTNISLGRGANLPLDVGFCDGRDEGVLILRPLKELSAKEVAFYCVFHKLMAVFVPSLTTKASRMASIRKLTEDFLLGLNVDFPSTLSAVNKIGEKLTARKEKCTKCILCKGYLEAQNRDSSSHQATKFSLNLMREIRSNNDDSCQNECQEGTETDVGSSENRSCSDENSGSRKYVTEEHLCYGCRLVFVDMDQADELIASLMASYDNVFSTKDY
ncbi:hypothetical protein J437_LFUL017053 [Ladona fulva]|uniref:Cytoplasmic tRNA 2-thiolation protein 2 n=1 Tax=Ladona fulva TaxID=123851 RepID=A0A8K0KKA0_LADFU|nr:hypothetical protein J437_LFUL017053 [Ladona fulva]